MHGHRSYASKMLTQVYKKKWYEDNRERLKGAGKMRESKWKYRGITLTWQEFLEKLVEQDYRCKICGKVIDIKAHPDHNHVTGEVRGILCGPCNQAIGLVCESISVLKRLVAHLQTVGHRFDSVEDLQSRLFHRKMLSTRDITRRESVWKHYGIDIRYHEFLELLKLQDYRCAICQGGIDTSTPVDHCKATGVIRGCLCQNCNRAIGHLYDSISIAESAIDYLRSYN